MYTALKKIHRIYWKVFVNHVSLKAQYPDHIWNSYQLNDRKDPQLNLKMRKALKKYLSKEDRQAASSPARTVLISLHREAASPNPSKMVPRMGAVGITKCRRGRGEPSQTAQRLGEQLRGCTVPCAVNHPSHQQFYSWAYTQRIQKQMLKTRINPGGECSHSMTHSTKRPDRCNGLQPMNGRGGRWFAHTEASCSATERDEG